MAKIDTKKKAAIACENLIQVMWADATALTDKKDNDDKTRRDAFKDFAGELATIMLKYWNATQWTR